MTPSYLVRLLLLSSASFFVVNLVLSALVALITPSAIRRAGTMRPQDAARWLLSLRLMPAGLSALFVAAFCVPAYLRFEPAVAREEAGAICVSAAVLGALICAFAIGKGLRALVASALYFRRSGGQESQVQGETVWIVPERGGLALAGIMRPKVLISAGALRSLSSEQLTVALCHERAHRASHDNLKRLLILLAPSIFPALRSLEKKWAQCAEWAADDLASAGDPNRSAALAEALVRVARLQSGIAMPALVTSLAEENEDLPLRVDRLLDGEVPVFTEHRAELAAISAGALLLALAAINPGSLRVVHHLLEALLD
jgi:beta-lactamase regulating signal transducer with metallopeptidase domain